MKHLLSTLLIAAVTACGPDEARDPPAPRVPDTRIQVRAETLTTYATVTGSVVPRRRAEIATRMMARVAAVPVDIGARVSPGDVLVRLGTEDIAASRQKAEAAVTLAVAARDEAAKHAARMDTLLAQDAVARVQRDQAHLQLTHAESQLAIARATLADVETAAGYAALRAPFAGTIVRRNVDPGDLAAPGMPLVVLESTGPVEIVLDVAVTLGVPLEPGTALRVTARDGRVTTARVRAVAAGADPRARTREVRATIDEAWPTGLAVSARLPTGRHVGIAIPASLVVRRGQLTGVRVVDGDLITVRWIRTGRTLDDGRVEVVSGLSAGTWLAS